MTYDIGNAGDLLKHGVLAEVIRWQVRAGIPLRFIDLFGGEPWREPVPEVVRRIRSLPTTCALRAAQTEIEDGRYYGSGLLVRRVAEKSGASDDVRVLTTDKNPERRKRLRDCGLCLLDDDFPDADLTDGYTAFENDIVPNARAGDLVLIDPFHEFLPERSPTIVPRMALMTRRAAVLLFVLNLNPENRVGQRFDQLLKDHLPGAWRLTCPKLNTTGVKGESRFHAEIVLAAPWLLEGKSSGSGDVGNLRKRLAAFAEQLASVLELSRLPFRVVGP